MKDTLLSYRCDISVESLAPRFWSTTRTTTITRAKSRLTRILRNILFLHLYRTFHNRCFSRAKDSQCFVERIPFKNEDFLCWSDVFSSGWGISLFGARWWSVWDVLNTTPRSRKESSFMKNVVMFMMCMPEFWPVPLSQSTAVSIPMDSEMWWPDGHLKLATSDCYQCRPFIVQHTRNPSPSVRKHASSASFSNLTGQGYTWNECLVQCRN